MSTPEITEARPHPTGGYRAYKKVNGREFQFYSQDKAEADRKQQELNALARLKTKSPFSSCGRLIGYRIKPEVRMDRNPAVVVKVQIGKKSTSWRFSPDGSFEAGWHKVVAHWKEAHGLLPQDVAAYASKLRAAKRLYRDDVDLAAKTLASMGPGTAHG